ncbi:hypothetical protein JCM16303_003147 [Sporobolomyces ruberrimus]
MTVARDPPSIYTSLPPLPPFSAQYDPLSSTLAERENLDQLAQLAQEGPANYVLRRILIDEAEKEETRRKRREKYDEGSDSDKGLNQRDPQDDDGEPPTKRKRTRSSSKKRGWSSTAAEGGDDEETQAEQRSSGLRKGKGKAKRQHQQLERPRLAKELPPTELPEHFPSGSLLSSLHLHASQHFTSHHSILPPLTTSTPLLPPHLLTHFTNLSKEINEEEEALLKKEGMTRRDLKKVREGRLGKMGRGGRKGVWKKAEKGFDASGLVALGMLTKLLVEDSLKPPPPPPRIEISQHSPPPPLPLIDELEGDTTTRTGEGSELPIPPAPIPA